MDFGHNKDTKYASVGVLPYVTAPATVLIPLRLSEAYHCLQQPTAFSISTLLFPDIDESPILNTSLYSYVESRQQHRRYLDTTETSDYSDFEWRGQFHGLLLHIRAAADYYTTNRTLMIDVPPVKVDISEVNPDPRIPSYLTVVFSSTRSLHS